MQWRRITTLLPAAALALLAAAGIVGALELADQNPDQVVASGAPPAAACDWSVRPPNQ
ncbi:hypothetical protein [Actinophytocola sp.]|jgi:hypothetical protein|uniref:hypothetical protein n=1 Tax=Actinophytocola sp. TaxID=1872138 RepID=UPI002ED82022